MRIIFMGTPDFAVAPLEALMQAGEEVCLVVTQPDRARGRGREMEKTPVKRCAEKWGIPVFQPDRIRNPEAAARLREEDCDLIVVAAFGQILSQEILNIPPRGAVNVHASLLPKYRGAAPIQQAVIDGEKESGVTIMQMDAGLDTGDILFQERIPLAPKETGESLYEKLAALGGELLVKALPAIAAGELTRIPQDERLSSYAGMLRRDMGTVDWNESAAVIERRIRGLNPWPCACTVFRGKKLKLWAGDAGEQTEEDALLPGTVAGTDRGHIYVSTSDGVLALTEVQLEGKKRISAEEFLRGYPVKRGERLG
ncbi:methionyl-tRNA formyltransferase [Lachnoclostridium sp. Marseille-P6806]|uniref:methionyl-tRNA formyltransferase n=1 Tax=Lachnoclostridium sp. Marseille-P6806 TaxID=2364793 RepID=UPI00103263B3|nr:methionyl-tRNA formyltransferase [Lachnoclostridium sp. Marseille-P6806]